MSDHVHDGQEESTIARETVVLNSNNQPVSIPRPTTPTATEVPIEAHHDEAVADENSRSPRGRKVKTWLRSHFSRASRSEEDRPDQRSFLGGASLAGHERGGDDSSTSLSDRSASVRDVAMAGRERDGNRAAPGPGHGLLGAGAPEHDVSPMSSSSEEDVFGGSGGVRERSSSSGLLGLPLPGRLRDPAARKSQSPARDSKFREMM